MAFLMSIIARMVFMVFRKLMAFMAFIVFIGIVAATWPEAVACYVVRECLVPK